ncbi:helix-turn-helix domain-containing protein [Mariniblastus sp.]|nr:helix-turn-helix domain-containing protein [Mariniblastus sp.]
MAEKLSDYLKTAEAAEFLGVSQNTLRTWGRRGKVPTHRTPINGYRLFRKQDLDALVQEIEKAQPFAPSNFKLKSLRCKYK